MLKTRFILGILASLFSLSLEVSIQAQPKEAKAGAATVSGLVTLKGEPARGVTVLLREPGLVSSNSPRVTTDENGRFRFSGVIAGMHSISALMPGYILSGSDESGRGLTFNVAEGGKVDNIHLEIKPGAVIAGRITDSEGRPVIEETVNLSKLDKNGNRQIYRDNSPYNEMYRTDERGDYRIFGLPEGRYLVSIGSEQKPGAVSRALSGVIYPRAYYPSAYSEAEAKVIEVAEGSEATDIDITVPAPIKTYGVYGRVLNADTGQPVSGMEIIVGAITQDGKFTSGLAEIGERSKPNGEFRFTVVGTGKYVLLARADSRDSNEIIGEPVTFDVGEGDTTGVEAIVRRGGSISGVVVIEGTSDPKILSKLSQVRLYGFNRPSRSTITGLPIISGIPMVNININADGGFRIGGLQAGKIAIVVDQSPDTRGLSVGRIDYNGAAHNEIEVDTGEQVTGVRVILSYNTYTLRGELKIVGPPPSLSFTALARRVDQPMQSLPSAAVDARGQFVFEYMAPGEYEIRVFPTPSPQGERLDPQTVQLISSFKVKAVVSDNSQPVTLVVDLGRKEVDR